MPAAVFVALFTIVKVSVALRLTPTGSGVLSLVNTGAPGELTVSIAVAELPIPLLVELTWPVVFVAVPVVMLVTSIWIVQFAPGAMGPPPVNEIDASP